jgi:hypothetical protein
MSLSKKHLVLFIIPLFAFTIHKYYISLTKIDYKKESNSVQITLRLFIDDLQDTLNSTYAKDFELGLPNESKKIDSLIYNYVVPKFIVKINSVDKTYTYLGKEYEDEVVYVYLEIENISTINSMEIKNTIFMEKFPNQKNIIKLNINTRKKTFLLTNKKESDSIIF